MSKIHSRFIIGIEDKIAELFAPSITEGQIITAYVDEPVSPYKIKGENFFVASTVGNRFQEFHFVSTSEINAQSFSLEHEIPVALLEFVSVELNGFPLVAGTDFELSSNSISWSNKSLQDFGLLEGDIFTVSYPLLEDSE